MKKKNNHHKVRSMEGNVKTYFFIQNVSYKKYDYKIN